VLVFFLLVLTKSIEHRTTYTIDNVMTTQINQNVKQNTILTSSKCEVCWGTESCTFNVFLDLLGLLWSGIRRVLVRVRPWSWSSSCFGWGRVTEIRIYPKLLWS
jgi:hypothetical protein